MLLVTNAVGYYALPLYVGTLSSGTDLPTIVTSGAPSVFFLASGIGGLAVAPLYQRVPTQYIVAAGGVSTAAGVLWMGHATSLWELVCAYLLLSASLIACGPTVATVVLARRAGTAASRKQAIAVALAGMSTAGAVVTPAMAFMIEKLGLRATTQVLSVATLVVVLVVAWWGLRSAPVRRHDHAASVPRPVGARDVDDGLGTSTRPAALREWRTVLLASIAFSCFMSPQVALMTQMYSIAADRSFPSPAVVISLLASLGLISRFVGIVLVRILSPYLFMVILSALQAIAAVVIISVPTPAGVLIGTVLVGLAIGNASVLMPIIAMELFGAAVFPTKLAVIQLVSSLASAAAPLVFAWLRELTAGFDVAVAQAGALSGLGVPLFLLLARAARRRAQDDVRVAADAATPV
jgi:hypothetical protein